MLYNTIRNGGVTPVFKRRNCLPSYRALFALSIVLLLAGCPTTETITEVLIPATNLQRRIVPAGILLGWDAPTAGEVDGFNVYNAGSADPLNGAPLDAEARSYLVTDLTASSVYTFELETIFSLSDAGSTTQRVQAVPITFADLPAGSADNPWTVASADELGSIATGFRSSSTVNGGSEADPLTLSATDSRAAYYIQTRDITLCADTTDTECRPFVPIGNEYVDTSNTAEPFTGGYDGGGNAIIGLRIDNGADDAPALRAWGLFGLVTGSSAAIRNVTLQAPDVTGIGITGMLVGRMSDGATVADSAAVGGTVANSPLVMVSNTIGGLVGAVGAGATLIENSYTTGPLNGDADNEDIGGLVGLVGAGASLIIEGSYTTDDVIGGAGDDNVGGLVGRVNGDIDGLSGTSVIISNSYATGNPNGGADDDNVGGLVGVITQEAIAIISNSYTTGNPNGGADGDNVGGLVGAASEDNGNVSISNSYTTGDVYGGPGNSDSVGGLVGHIADSVGTIENSYATGDISESEGGFSDGGGGLVGSVTNTATITIRNSHATGTINGSSGSDNFGGLVGLIEGTGTIVNSHATGTINGAGGNDNIGGFVGLVSRDSLTIRNSHAIVTINGSGSVGGLVGNMTDNTTRIRNSYAAATLDGGAIADSFGGLVGAIATSTIMIEKSYASGTINGNGGHDFIGGFVGRMLQSSNAITIENSYAAATLDGGVGNDTLGGLVGSMNSVISMGTETVMVTIENSYAAGPRNGGTGNDTLGGLVGSIQDPNMPTITNSYYDGTDPADPNARTLAQLRCPSTPNPANDSGPVGGFTVPADATSTDCTVDPSDNVMVYVGWNTPIINWDFGSPVDLPSIIDSIDSDGVVSSLAGQPVDPY